MPDHRPSILVADTARALPLMAKLLGEDSHIVKAPTYAQAVRCLRKKAFDAVVLGYHFDDMRPDRLLRYIRGEPALRGKPVVLVRGLPFLHVGLDDEELRAAYTEIGADAYLPLDKSATGPAFDEGSSTLREAVARLIRERTPSQSAA